MIYKIFYQTYKIIEISYYKDLDDDSSSWYLELDSQITPNILKCAHFLKDEKSLDEFINDTNNIAELRDWLWDCHDNSLIDFDKIDKRYNLYRNELEKIIRDFITKYNLTFMTD